MITFVLIDLHFFHISLCYRCCATLAKSDEKLTLSIGTPVFAIYLIVGDMDNILSPGAWHVSSRLYKEFLKKLE